MGAKSWAGRRGQVRGEKRGWGEGGIGEGRAAGRFWCCHPGAAVWKGRQQVEGSAMW